MNKDEECQEDEDCRCPKCIESMETEMAFHFREYRLSAVKDKDENIIDVRTNEIVIRK